MTKPILTSDPSILDAVPLAEVRRGKGKAVPIEVTSSDLRAIRAAIKMAFDRRKTVAPGSPFLEDVLPRFERTRADYLSLARRVALELAKKLKRPITVDDVREICPPPAEYDGRVMGAVFQGSDWVFHAHVRSGRRTCHKRHIASFERA